MSVVTVRLLNKTTQTQRKNYSEITVETRTQLKSVIFTTDIFAVCDGTPRENTSGQ